MLQLVRLSIDLLANKNDLVEKQFQERELKAPHFFQEGPKCQESTYPKRKQHATTECASMQTMLVLKKIKTKSMMIGDTSHKEKIGEFGTERPVANIIL